jgi:hypothetical protein
VPIAQECACQPSVHKPPELGLASNKTTKIGWPPNGPHQAAILSGTGDVIKKPLRTPKIAEDET